MSDATRDTPTPAARPWYVRAKALAARLRRAWIALLVLGALAAAAGLVYRRATRPVAVRVAKVETGVVRQETIGPGTVQARFSVSVSARITGTLERVLVDVGDEVDSGQPLAQLDTTELTARLEAARWAASGARRELTLAKANLAKARADRDISRLRRARSRKLAALGTIAVAQADADTAAFRAAAATERAARATIEVRKAALARFLSEQRVAETILSYATITSPMKGVITRRALEPGAAVAARTVLFQLVDPDSLWVETLVDLSLVDRVRVGQPATIRLRSGREHSGRVARVALEADPVTREIAVYVSFDRRPPRFAIHEQVDVVIHGEDRRGLKIPSTAIEHSNGSSHVFVVKAGVARRKDVRLGTIGSRRALVLAGLDAGDLIPFLNARDNVVIAMTLNGVRKREARRRAVALLEYLGLGHRALSTPDKLSGGEQQRVAIARALANQPRVIFADEPTASLDTERGFKVMDMLKRIARERKSAVITVTHDERMVSGFDTLKRMSDGRFVVADASG